MGIRHARTLLDRAISHGRSVFSDPVKNTSVFPTSTVVLSERVAAPGQRAYASTMVQANIGNSVPAPDPARGQFEHLVGEFGKAWEAGKPSAMADVFTEDGTFIPGPFDPPIRGRAAIEAYWGDVPREQSAIGFRFGEIFVAGPWFATEFKCTYRRIRTGEWIEITGALFCETETEKISEMRMYWDRSNVRAP